jgi:hypothetical protein
VRRPNSLALLQRTRFSFSLLFKYFGALLVLPHHTFPSHLLPPFPLRFLFFSFLFQLPLSFFHFLGRILLLHSPPSLILNIFVLLVTLS